MATATKPSLSTLDRRAEREIRAYMHKIFHPEWGLSEEDVMAASHHADQLYLDATDLPATECSDRTLDIAFRVKDELMAEYFG